MKKKATKTFREYTQRWRDIVAQVQPPLTEKEATMLFVNTLRAPYYERLIGNASKNFTDMVILGEIIESAIKQGKIKASAVTKNSGSLKKKKETRKLLFFRVSNLGVLISTTFIPQIILFTMQLTTYLKDRTSIN